MNISTIYSMVLAASLIIITIPNITFAEPSTPVEPLNLRGIIKPK